MAHAKHTRVSEFRRAVRNSICVSTLIRNCHWATLRIRSIESIGKCFGRSCHSSRRENRLRNKWFHSWLGIKFIRP